MGLDREPDAGAQVVRQHQRRHLPQRGGGGVGQLHLVEAVAIVRDHLLEPAHLPLDAAQALQQRLPLLRRAAQEQAPVGGYCQEFAPSPAAPLGQIRLLIVRQLAARILALMAEIKELTACLERRVAVASGGRQGHRVNFGGNRQLNRAIHIIALTQRRCEPLG